MPEISLNSITRTFIHILKMDDDMVDGAHSYTGSDHPRLRPIGSSTSREVPVAGLGGECGPPHRPVVCEVRLREQTGVNVLPSQLRRRPECEHRSLLLLRSVMAGGLTVLAAGNDSYCIAAMILPR